MSSAPNWTNKLNAREDRPQTLNDLLEEFKNCFGASFDIDLSAATEESRPTEITLSSKDYIAYIENKHPYLKEADIEVMGGDAEEEGDVTAVLTTSRLQTALEQYAIERLPELFDKKRFSLDVDHPQLDYNIDQIHEAVTDYSQSGIIRWPSEKPRPTHEEITAKLDHAWTEALQLYTKSTSLPPR